MGLGSLLFERVFQFVNNYFELIVSVLVVWLINLGLVYALVFFRTLSQKTIRNAINRVLHYCLTVGLVLLLVITAYSFYINRSEKEALDFSYRVTPTTDWVQEQLQIYFIHEHQLIRVNSDGSGRTVVLDAPDLIRAYYFSPDGQQLSVVTGTRLYLVNRADGRADLVESLDSDQGGSDAGIKSVIDGVAWAPDSRMLIYRRAQWTKFGSTEQWILYELASGLRRAVKNPALRMSKLTWARDGHCLYYMWFNALDTSISGVPYEVKVYEIPLETLVPRLALKFPFVENRLPMDNLALRGIELYTGAEKLSFGREGLKNDQWVSPYGSRLGIDQFDNLYVIKNRWWRRRLYRIPRVPRESGQLRHQYGAGDYVLRNVRWLPGGRYAVMEHYFLGILILEPGTGQIGLLDNELGNTFGWYTP